MMTHLRSHQCMDRPCCHLTNPPSPPPRSSCSVVRVITARLPTTGSVSAYLRGVACPVAAVLIAKKSVLEARSWRDAVEVREQVDARVRDMAARLGRQGEPPPLRRFPPELGRLPEMLFHLRRGPLLGSILGHEDERAVLRHLFLQVRHRQAHRTQRAPTVRTQSATMVLSRQTWRSLVRDTSGWRHL
jgi:hypothetical protein